MSKKFWKTTWAIITSIFYVTWLILGLIFVVLPTMAINPIRRAHLKNKMRRSMVRNGMPKEAARTFARRYNKEYLRQFGSVGGLYRITRQTRKIEDGENDSDLSSNLLNKSESHFITI